MKAGTDEQPGMIVVYGDLGTAWAMFFFFFFTLLLLVVAAQWHKSMSLQGGTYLSITINLVLPERT